MPHRRNQSQKRGLGTRKRRTKQRKCLIAEATAYKNIVITEGVPYGLVHIREPRLQPLARKLNIPFLPAVVGFKEYRRGHWGTERDGIVIAALDEPKLRAAITVRKARNNDAVRERRRKARDRADARYTKSFAETVRERFPQMPVGLEFEIAERATEKGKPASGPEQDR